MNLWKANKNLILQALIAASLIGTSQSTFANRDVDDGSVPEYVSNNSLGQVLIYPYYTVRGGKDTIFNIFNTSNKTIATKVRFHESHNSRDVLDFTLILSPYDKWSGTISAGAAGAAPIFKTRDNSCTVPQIPSTGVALNASAYNASGFADADADQSNDRMNEGYLEVIAMGQADAGDAFGTDSSPGVGFNSPYTAGNPGNVAYNSTHVNGVPRDCAAVQPKFVAGAGATVYSTPATNYSADPNADGNPAAADEFDAMVLGFNPLRGALTIVGADDGVGFGTSALAIADWVFSTGAHNNHVTAQQFPYFLEPTLVSAAGLWTVNELFFIDTILEARTVVNEWANNPINGAATDWVIQFPTKAYHVDIPYANNATQTGCNPNNIQAAYNGYRGGWAVDPLNPANCGPLTTDAPLLPQIAPFETRFGPTGSPVTVTTTTYDKEEREGQPDGVSFSPAQPGAANALPWESNIITFGGPSVLSSSSPELTLDPVATIPGAETNGQAMMVFTNADTVSGGGTMNNLGLPVIGFVAIERDQGDAALSYGQIMNHSYENFDTSITPDL